MGFYPFINEQKKLSQKRGSVALHNNVVDKVVEMMMPERNAKKK